MIGLENAGFASEFGFGFCQSDHRLGYLLYWRVCFLQIQIQIQIQIHMQIQAQIPIQIVIATTGLDA